MTQLSRTDGKTTPRLRPAPELANPFPGSGTLIVISNPVHEGLYVAAQQ